MRQTSLSTRKNVTARSQGFTIVELLIVIVVIGILAAIVIVAYNGIQDQAKANAKISDIKSLQRIIELYYAKYGSYPNTGGGRYYQRSSGNDFIPDVVPEFASKLPKITDGPTDSAGDNNTYMYQSDGTTYRIMRILSPMPQAEYSKIPSSMYQSGYSDRWGVWSN